MLLALTTNQKLGLAGTAAVFIAFALLSALVIPRANPGFPGRRGLVPFIVVTAILTIAMLGAVEVFAKEEHPETEAPGETTPEPPPPPATTGTTGTTTTTEQPPGSPEAGKAVFLSAGCGACHTFAAAGTSGSVGPDLDEALQGKDPEFIRQSIVDPNAEIAQGYSAGVMPQNFGEQLSPKQLDDLVAFLASG
ncbi:MAG: c-type cytochrome [Gaiellales bacterium]